VLAFLMMGLIATVGLAGLAVMFYGAYLETYVTADGDAPFAAAAVIVGVVAVAIMGLAMRLADRVQRWAGRHGFDAAMDFVVVAGIAFYLALGVGAVFVVRGLLRYL
jgi:small neutral amino acid transporter SnatA (MarC family)